ncbi:nucleotide disphospho-sugar-binding domain-containing protein [Streptomyces tremellae]|uniref:DUF1205 domain-containing protein n=1 Tax=Streptomyces tremellae TaxID=1124239 RepID=A0ABP7EYT9_9ACTN
MRVLFVTSDWAGHYFCMVPLGWALQAAGHQVRVACAPPQQSAVERTGLVAVPVLESVDMVTMGRMFRYLDSVAGNRPGMPLHPYTGRQVASLDEFDVAAELPAFQRRAYGAIRRSYDGAVSLGRRLRPDLVVHDLTAPEGALIAQLTGCPSLYHPPGLFGTAETEAGVDLGDGDPSDSFARYGRPRWHQSHARYVVDLSPDEALPPVGPALRIPARYVPYNGPGEVPDWLRRPRGGPRVVVMVSRSVAMETGQEPLPRQVVDALLSQGAEVVLTTSRAQAEVLGPLPEAVRVLHDFPFKLLMESADAVVHQGSSNALLTAAVYGVPQLALAYTQDGKVTSRRIADTGAAVALDVLRTDPAEAARAALEVLVSPGRRAAADRLRASMARRPSPAELVPALELLARTGTLGTDDLPVR